MPSLPWYKWYPSKWLSSETRFGLTLAERSIYRDLLDNLYERGSLPSDAGTLAQLAAVSPQEFDAAWPKVSRNFIPCEDDPTRLTNRVAVQILRQRAEMSEAGRAAGKASGASRRISKAGRADEVERTNRSTIKTETQMEKEKNTDLDLPARSAKAETARAEFRSLRSFLEDLIGRLPSAGTASNIMYASSGATETEVIEVIRDASSRSKTQPRTFRWCEVAVYERFHRGDSLRPAAPAQTLPPPEDFEQRSDAFS